MRTNPPRKKRKTASNPSTFSPRTPYILCHPFCHPIRLGGLLVAIILLVGTGTADEKPKRKGPSLAEQFLIFGTVFEERGFALPGAEIAVRRAGEKKTRWRQYSDARGEFAVRVPPGAEYDLTVKAKGYAEQTRKVDARKSAHEDTVFQMQPAPGGKKK